MRVCALLLQVLYRKRKHSIERKHILSSDSACAAAAGKGHIDEACASANVVLNLHSHDDKHKGGDKELLSSSLSSCSTSRQAERFFASSIPPFFSFFPEIAAFIVAL